MAFSTEKSVDGGSWSSLPNNAPEVVYAHTNSNTQSFTTNQDTPPSQQNPDWCAPTKQFYYGTAAQRQCRFPIPQQGQWNLGRGPPRPCHHHPSPLSMPSAPRCVSSMSLSSTTTPVSSSSLTMLMMKGSSSPASHPSPPPGSMGWLLASSGRPSSPKRRLRSSLGAVAGCSCSSYGGLHRCPPHQALLAHCASSLREGRSRWPRWSYLTLPDARLLSHCSFM